jgi:hypothetical protein
MGLTLVGNVRRLLNKSYCELREDKRAEHLEDRKLMEKLSALISDVIENKEEFKAQSILNKRIEEFLTEIIKPEEKYQVLFKIHNLHAQIEETEFWDCTVASYNNEQLTAWGFNPEKWYMSGSEVFENQNVIVISEQGHNIAEVVKRARVKAIRRLRVLQNYLKEEFIHDEQLFFKLSTEYVVKREIDSVIVSSGFDRKHSAIKYDYPQYLIDGIGAANKDFALVQELPPNLKDLIERALHWIGLAISEIDPDIKISFLSTALETLLATQDDSRKGERIALRGYLLAMEVKSDHHSMPQEVLRVYNLRSTIVHGSNISVASKHDYWFMLDFTQATLKHFIQFVSENNLTKPKPIFDKLLQSEHLAPYLAWLEEFFDDQYSRSISKAIREDLLKIQT